jgi:hypothetical protein
MRGMRVRLIANATNNQKAATCEVCQTKIENDKELQNIEKSNPYELAELCFVVGMLIAFLMCAAAFGRG